MARQLSDRITELTRDMASMYFYGFLNQTAEAGSATEARSTLGLLQALSQANSLLDYTTTSLTEAKLNDRFQALFDEGNPRNARYAIACNPKHARTIVGWGSDVVRTELSDRTWGRYVSTFVSDLGSEAEIIPDPVISQSNLFIINMDKTEFVPFRDFTAEEWGKGTSTPNGKDLWKKRYLGEFTVKVVDPLKSHSGFGYLTWA
jgi:hypothetical protein